MSTIYRTKKVNNYQVIDNRIFTDTSISYKARFLLGYMLTKPADWVFFNGNITKETGISRGVLSSLFRELVGAGYVTRERINNPENGKFETITTAYESPNLVKNTDDGKPAHGKTDDGKPCHILNKDTNQVIIKPSNYTKKDTKVSLAKAKVLIPDSDEIEVVEYGNTGVNKIFDFWEETTGQPILANQKKNRYACYNLLRRHGEENLKKLIRGVAQANSTPYAPNIFDFCSLQHQQDKLIHWGRKQIEQHQVISLDDIEV